MRVSRRWILYLLCGLALWPGIDCNSSAQPPYPPSPVIAGVEWDFNNTCRSARGSDLWPMTWAADDNVYTSWGDGGGFGGDNVRGRVSLGFARLTGHPGQCTGVNVWGGADSLYPASFEGKVAGLLSVDGTLYALINRQDDDSPHVTLAWSSDFSRSWQLASWSWSSREFAPSTMLNFGKDYAGARDEFLYFYGGSWGESQNVYLIRVHKGRVKDRDAYEFFHGLDNDQQPTWASAIDQDRPVFTDKNLLNEMNGASKTSVTYNPGVGRYLLTIPHGGMDKLGIFDAPEPWGPWTTVVYDDNWPGVPLDVEHFIAWTQGAPGDQEGLLYVFPSKWISQDGTQMTMVFSGVDAYDSFNAVPARLILR